MEQLLLFLTNLRGDVFKLLPMKEDELEGADNHLSDFLSGLIITLKGGVFTYPELAKEKKYLYMISNLQYILNTEVPFWRWRKIILASSRDLDDLLVFFNEEVKDE